MKGLAWYNPKRVFLSRTFDAGVFNLLAPVHFPDGSGALKIVATGSKDVMIKLLELMRSATADVDGKMIYVTG